MNTQHIDKSSIKHFLFSLIAAIFSTEFSLGLGLGKEYGDYANYGHFCHWDILFDTIGIILGTIIRLLLIKLIYGHWQWMWY